MFLGWRDASSRVDEDWLVCGTRHSKAAAAVLTELPLQNLNSLGQLLNMIEERD
ncbi:hypothetical protein D1872_300050 [compost metagenome]